MGMVKKEFTEYEIGLESMKTFGVDDSLRSQNFQGPHWRVG